MTYEEKKAIADKYLFEMTAGAIDWDSLSDINSLHDVDDEEGIKSLCDDRLSEDGFESFMFSDY